MRLKGLIAFIVFIVVLILAVNTFSIFKIGLGANPLLQFSQKGQVDEQTATQSFEADNQPPNLTEYETLTVSSTKYPYGFSVPPLPTNLEWRIVSKDEERSDYPDLVWHTNNWRRKGEIELPGTESLAVINVTSGSEEIELEKRRITTFTSDYRIELVKRGWNGSCPSFKVDEYIFCTASGGGVGLNLEGFYKKIGDKVQIVNITQGLPPGSSQGDIDMYPHNIQFRVFISEVISESELLKLIR